MLVLQWDMAAQISIIDFLLWLGYTLIEEKQAVDVLLRSGLVVI